MHEKANRIVAENQSPRAKKHPTPGATAKCNNEEVMDSLVGGPKHTSTGGAYNQYPGVAGVADEAAEENWGIQSPIPPIDENFSEGSDYNDRSQGATLTRGSID